MITSKSYPEINSCQSTQDEARTLLSRVAPDDKDLHWLVCKQQTNGRGRQGATWQSGSDPEAHLITSVGFTNASLDALGPLLSLVAGHALFTAVGHFKRQTRAEFFLKWPNDLYAFFDQKNPVKIAGILAERRPKRGTVIGFGVNLHWSPDLLDRETGHLASYIESGYGTNLRHDLFSHLQASLSDLLNQYLKNSNAFQERFIALLRNQSMRAFLKLSEVTISGRQVKPLALNNDGSLDVFDLQNQTPITLR